MHTVASLLKLYLRELPEPVIPFARYEDFLSCAQLLTKDEGEVSASRDGTHPGGRLPGRGHVESGLINRCVGERGPPKCCALCVALLFSLEVSHGSRSGGGTQAAHPVLAFSQWVLLFSHRLLQTQASEVSVTKEPCYLKLR